jgi:hypothetical protein
MSGDPCGFVHQGDIVRHKSGGAPWLVLEVAIDPARREMIVARRESIGIVEGVRFIDDYIVEKVAR